MAPPRKSCQHLEHRPKAADRLKLDTVKPEQAWRRRWVEPQELHRLIEFYDLTFIPETPGPSAQRDTVAFGNSGSVIGIQDGR